MHLFNLLVNISNANWTRVAVFAQEVKLLVSNMYQSIRFPYVISLVNHTADMFTSSTYVFRTRAIQREAATNNDVLGILILRIGTSEKHQHLLTGKLSVVVVRSSTQQED